MFLHGLRLNHTTVFSPYINYVDIRCFEDVFSNSSTIHIIVQCQRGLLKVLIDIDNS